jgi:hypothetical protein
MACGGTALLLAAQVLLGQAARPSSALGAQAETEDAIRLGVDAGGRGTLHMRPAGPPGAAWQSELFEAECNQVAKYAKMFGSHREQLWAGVCSLPLSGIMSLSNDSTLEKRYTLARIVVPAACNIGQCTAVFPLFANLCRDADVAVREFMVGDIVPRVCRAGHCSEILPAVLALANDTDEIVRVKFTKSVSEICFAGPEPCRDVVPALLQLAGDTSTEVQTAVASHGITSACLAGKEICTQILPAFDALYSSSSTSNNDDIRKALAARTLSAVCSNGLCQHAIAPLIVLGSSAKSDLRKSIASHAAPAACAAGFFDEVIPLMENLTKDNDLEVRQFCTEARDLCINVKSAKEKAEQEARLANDLREAAEAEARSANESKQRALDYLKDVEVQRVKADVLKTEALEMKKLSIVSEAEARSATNKVELKTKMAEDAEHKAEQLRMQMLGLALALLTASGPALMFCFKKASGSD